MLDKNYFYRKRDSWRSSRKKVILMLKKYLQKLAIKKVSSQPKSQKDK